jgi:glycosyltransferase involved in cell wall biosynthesis
MVLHLHFAELQTPKGNVARCSQDPPTFAVEGIRTHQPFQKWNDLLGRRRQEKRYGDILAERIVNYSPDIVLSANTPIDVQERIIDSCQNLQAAMVIWVQDFYSLAVQYVLRMKMGSLIGDVISRYFIRLEKQQFQRCQKIIYITDDFKRLGERYGVDAGKCHVIENWGPLGEIQVAPRNNDWARCNGFVDKFCILYSGTMGWKHNPKPLLSIAEGLRNRADVEIVVVAQGPGRDRLTQEVAARALRNVRVFDFQPYTEMSDVLGTADVLIGVLDRDAGTFCVPSKILSYLCAARPTILVGPGENLAAKTLLKAGAGFVVPMEDDAGLLELVHRLMRDQRLREELGLHGRCYAERSFDVGIIAERFEHILEEALRERAVRCGQATDSDRVRRGGLAGVGSASTVLGRSTEGTRASSRPSPRPRRIRC